MPLLDLRTEINEFHSPKKEIHSWEAYFSNYIAYVTSYGAENVELHRNIDGYVLLMSDIDLASDEELYSFASFFLGHSNLMHDLFHILKKSQNDDLITEYCGQGNTDGINATYFKRRMTDRVRPEFRLMIESGSSVGRRVKKAEKSPVFLLLLVRPLSPAFNEVLFSQDVYTANYFNTYPEFRAPPMTSSLVLAMFRDVTKALPNDSNYTSPIHADIESSSGHEVVTVTMQQDNQMQHISAQAKILFFKTSSSGVESEDRTTHIVISGVTFQELEQKNLPCFATYPSNVKIYIFVSGDHALQLLRMPTDAALKLIKSCVIASITEMPDIPPSHTKPSEIIDSNEYNGSETDDNNGDDVGEMAQSLSDAVLEESMDDEPAHTLKDVSESLTSSVSEKVLRVGSRVSWTPLHDPSESVEHGTVEALRKESYYGLIDVLEVNYTKDCGEMVYTTDTNPVPYEVRIEAISILEVILPQERNASEPLDASASPNSKISQTDAEPLPGNLVSTMPYSSDVCLEPILRIHNSGPPRPRSWITNLTREAFRCNRHDISIVLSITTWDGDSAGVTLADIAIENAPEWLMWSVDDSQSQLIRLHAQVGSNIDGEKHILLITLRHPIYHENEVKAELEIPLRY